VPIAVLVADALAAATLFAGRKARLFFPIAAALLVLVLIYRSQPRIVGDSVEYVAMSLNMAQLAPPSLSADDLSDAAGYLPGDAGTHLIKAEFRGADGRQDFPHFWFYSLLASPFVRAAVALHRSPVVGFTVLNGLLLLAAALVLDRAFGSAAAAFLVLGPVLWWVDKAHTEVFTVSLLAMAFALLGTQPWWSILALGAASTQNPPIAGAMLVVIAYVWLLQGGWRNWKVIAATTAGVCIAALHPWYYHMRLGIWSGLSSGLDRHVPSSPEITAALIDPNLGILVHDPFIVLAVAGAFIVALVRKPVRILSPRHLAALGIALLFVFSFTQTGNFNSGGTPGPSRYGLWLIPLAIPVIASSGSAWWMRTIAVASIVWCSSHFAPALPEGYLQPTELAARLWHKSPDLDNPLAEVFAERVSGHEPPSRPPIATAGCEKVLVVGNGVNVEWPTDCMPVPNAPSECRESGALCYANRLIDAYTFRRAPATPSWIVWEQTPEIIDVSAAAPQQTSLTLPPAERPQPTLWLADGWSYLEHELGAPRDTATWRWMGERARIDIVMPNAAKMRVRMVLGAYIKTRRLRISLGTATIATLTITEGQHGYQTPPVDFAAGSNSLLLETLDGTDSPGGQDARRLSVALFHADVAP
jgi:hypothetical protein